MLRVLLIEKDPNEADRLVKVLSEANHSIVPARDFSEATDALDVQKFDVVLFSHVEQSSEFIAFAKRVRSVDGQSGSGAKIRLLSRQLNPFGSVGANSTDSEVVDAFLPDDFGPETLTEAIVNLAKSVNRAMGNEIPILGKDEFREQVGYDSDLLVEIIDLFFAEIDDEIPQMKSALESGDFPRLAKLAHTMKGSLGSLHAKRARLRAQELEYAAKSADQANCVNGIRELESELDILAPHLTALRNHPQA